MDSTELLSEPRAKRQKTKHNKSAFERLKQLKGKGSKNKYEVSDVDNVYEVVDEKEYSKNVWERQEDDWIVDDDGSGYVEDGRDIFDDDLDSESVAAASKNAESKKRKKNISKHAGKGNIQAMLSSMPEKKKEVVNLDQDDILSDVLSGIDDNISTKPISKRKEFSLSNPEEQSAKDYMKNFAVPKPMKMKMKTKITKTENPKPTEVLKELPIENNKIDPTVGDDIMDDINIQDFEMEEVLSDEVVESGTSVQEELKQKVPEPKNEMVPTVVDVEPELTEEDKAFFESDDWDPMFDFESTTNENSVDVITYENCQLPINKNNEGEQVFRFYWWDAFEDSMKQPGIVFLFGKTYVESTKSYASCCVVVRNIERKVFLLPRPFMYDKDSEKETDTPVKMVDVYHEFNNEIADKIRVQQFRSRKVTRKYAFDPNIPLQSDYLEIRYSANNFPLDKNLNGRTFSHVFGTKTSFLEIFLLERKIKGPCWLEIKHPKPVANPLSWCKFEVDCNGPADVYIPEDKKTSPPPLVVATINIRTVLGSNPKDNEIVMIGCLVHNKYHVDKQPPNPPFQQHFCVFSKPTNQVLPLDLQEALLKFKGTQIEKCDSEKGLLNVFLNRFATIDPDLVVGHDLIDFHINVLCDRIERTKATQWSRFGKLKRKIVPTKFYRKDLMIGRLICDLKASARELIKSRSYDLDALCQTVLKLKEGERPVLESGDVLKMFSTSELLLKLVSFTMQDAGYITKMMYELNVMPLALQITNIAGNIMSKTLQGGRAQRNEFLLLHAFTEKNYICPDKFTGKQNPENAENQNPSKKKPTYSGGLVLDPKVGFYDKLILLMDFNSLYPSIIQEYNICFTTMQANLDTDTMLSNVSSEPGILPTEIRKLVESRREVKKLMANTDISNDLRMQYNIRQLALKLTANSMYGCLGFQNSRFYAKHLASLVTMKGRDILMHTRDLVQTMGYEVVYGDTDSIMVNTNIVDYDQVFKIGSNIKQSVNKSYKLVELDVDGVFKYMLLLKKKKYAAVTMSKNKSGEMILQQEHKGLDIVRRDWSMLASEVGKMVLNHILSNQSADERIENIQMVLGKIANDLKEGKVPIPLLVITKQLTKHPNQYTDKVPLSHVLVALRYNKKGGKPLGQGDTVPYIICEDGTNASATQRAYHVEEIKRSDTLKIDINYYLAHQIHPVVSRLCEPIDGLDAYQIANYLGIDASSFKKSKPKPTDTESVIISAPVKKYRHAKSFEFVCLSCKQSNSVTNLLVTNGSTSRLWLEKCSNDQCNIKPIEYLYSIENKLILNIKDYIEQYYNKILICEDPCCPNETSIVPIKFVGKYPVCNLCSAGLMYRKFSEGDLYEQICFYKHLCDTNKLDKKPADVVIEEAYQKLKESVDYFLKKSAYSVINLTMLYSKVSLTTTDADTEVPYVYVSDDEAEDLI